VKELFKRACDKVDPQGGDYDAVGHSPKYGFGRLNARTVIELAQPEPQNQITISHTFDAPLPDLQSVSFKLSVAENEPIEALTVSVDLKHALAPGYHRRKSGGAAQPRGRINKKSEEDLRRSHHATTRRVCRKELQGHLDFAD
jgi:hypothetical protein